MFTVTWISPDGDQMIYDAEQISFTPVSKAPSKRATVGFTTEKTHCTIDSGRVYVMNGQGATVASYILEGDSEFPHGLSEAA